MNIVRKFSTSVPSSTAASTIPLAATRNSLLNDALLKYERELSEKRRELISQGYAVNQPRLRQEALAKAKRVSRDLKWERDISRMKQKAALQVDGITNKILSGKPRPVGTPEQLERRKNYIAHLNEISSKFVTKERLSMAIEHAIDNPVSYHKKPEMIIDEFVKLQLKVNQLSVEESKEKIN